MNAQSNAIVTYAPPLALYAHFPWCVRKCPYCDFNSHKAPAQIPEQDYIAALLADLAIDLESHPSLRERELVSIFFGGGTPSLFGPQALERLLREIAKSLRFASNIEITLEANPGTIEHGQFAAYRAAGINRVSLGAQSFAPAQLQRLGRIHASGDIAAAVDELRQAGIDNFNLDLMYGLPEQTTAEALVDVEAATALQPAHISHYQLTLEPGTAFYHRPPPLPQSDDCYAMQLACQSQLAAAGYAQYEISAYAQPARQSLHNSNYWQFGDYLGLGAGAHGKLTEGTRIVRTERSKQPRDYLTATSAKRTIEHEVSAHELPFEFMLNALRLHQGFTRAQFESRTGEDWQRVSTTIAQAEARQLLVKESPDLWRPTELGQRFLNDLQAMFLPSR